MSYRVGFIGTGTIAFYLVQGLVARWGDEITIFCSPRNAERAAGLAAAYPQVSVLESNQAVVDAAEVVFLTILPGPAAEILAGLEFRESQRVISCVANLGLDRLQELLRLPATALDRLVPLPFVAMQTGPLLVYPGNGAQEVCDGLGELIIPESEQALGELAVITALMSPFYAVLGEVITWGSRQSLSAQTAADFTIAFFAALLDKARTMPAAELIDHWQEMTPGGLNATVVGHLQAGGSVAAWSEALDKVLARNRN